jgi:hypothetical protein
VHTEELAAGKYYGVSVCTAEDLAADQVFVGVCTPEELAANQLTLLLTTSCSLSVTQATGLAQWLEGLATTQHDSELMVLAVLVNLCDPLASLYAQSRAPAEVDMHAMM